AIELDFRSHWHRFSGNEKDWKKITSPTERQRRIPVSSNVINHREPAWYPETSSRREHRNPLRDAAFCSFWNGHAACRDQRRSPRVDRQGRGRQIPPTPG